MSLNVPAAAPNLMSASPEVMAKIPVIQATRADMAGLVNTIGQNPGVSTAAGTAINLLGVGLVGPFVYQGIKMIATGKSPAFLAKNA